MQLQPVLNQNIHGFAFTPPEVRLAKAHRSTADTNRLVEDNLGYVVAVARNLSSRFPAMEYDEVYQEASICLLKLVQRYDSEKGTLRALIRSHLLKDTHRAMARIMGVIRLPRGAEYDEVATVGPIEGAEFVADPRPARVERNLELRAALEDLLEDMPPRWASVLRRLFGIGCDAESIDAVAASMDVHRVRIQQLRDLALDRLRKWGAKKALAGFRGPEPR